MAQEYQYIQDILKEYYSPVIVAQIPKKSPMWAQIQKLPAKNMVGKRVYIPVLTQFPEAVGSRQSNNYNLPTADRSHYNASYIYMKRNYGRIQVDGFAIASSKGKGGWVDQVTAETKNISSAFAIELDRQVMGRGTSILALVDSTSGSKDLDVKDPHGITGDTPKTKWFRTGMSIDLVDAANGTVHEDGEQITVKDNNTITLPDTPTSEAAGDYLGRHDAIYIDGSGNVTDNTGDMMGIDGIIGSDNPWGSDFQGIDATSVTEWQSWVDTSSKVLDETVIQEGLDSIEKVTPGEAPNLALTTYDLRNKLIEIIRADRLVQGLNLKGGWSAIKYQGGSVSLPIMTHKYCPVGYWYYISLPHLKFYTLKKLVWDDKGGGVVKPVADKDAYEAWFKIYANLGTDARAAHGKYTNLTVS